MARRRLLFLAHRIPYPPDKGDKIRAWHMLDHLAETWEVDLGCLVDDPADLAHLPVLEARCATVRHARLTGAARRLRAMAALRPGRPLSLGWFHEPGLYRWVREGLASGRYDAVLAYSSTMAAYVVGAPKGAALVLDMVDVDSEKWRAYAATTEGPMRHVWAREARTLLAFERRAALAFDRTILVSPDEAAHFAALAPGAADRIDWVENGVDLRHFDAALELPSPFEGGRPAIVFTGTMDYRPNVEAVRFFADHVMPRLAGLDPAPVFHVVGANPAPSVRALAARGDVRVTGRVPDVRPYLAHAAVAVAPLGIARGIQNKVLEAMAMARPVVASPQAFEGVRAVAGRDLLVADGAEAMAAAVAAVLRGEHPAMGSVARVAVARGHDWGATLSRLDRILDEAMRKRLPETARVA
ncbi:TIGR03087 family PEP-CTERM/XrtA system glycosyltransferase [Neoroseomonas soli]|uniref:TIGR03087 family PEP-CTERM/XrtA system glycosyltransferase n=1 Tax=Neoroseomonas soli TaxID=1081025 RepID=A0A9X9WSP1_9PROT|nr:TIGR03087 family PEP-CTERM/XrtA system glycosyltransferase [Neoroseomonas soli]MBR0670170.1 TIGR03087 family PEP-CTERM/XrtA system glycosyltransferase [Neoroseomonas soli]